MRIILTKTSLTHHRLEVIRDDGTCESAVLETKTFAPHDFIHYALESIAGLQGSVFGLIARGHGLVELNGKDAMRGASVPRSELVVTEMVAGALTNIVKGATDDIAFLRMMRDAFAAHDLPMPTYLDADFLHAFRQRMRALLGHWRALAKGTPMELDWPAA